jgi:transposase
MALATQDSRASVARRLGISETTLRNWVANYLAEEARQADPLAVSPSEFEELRWLRREVEELRAEKEILRKAAAYFAQETIRSAASDSSPTTVTPTASSGSAGSSVSPARGSTPSSAGRPRRGEAPTRS